MEIIQSVLYFILAIGVLVTVHESGHFLVARWLGVKVLRFSVGFGRPLWMWRSPKNGIEYVVAAIPLGGYVKMLDERETEVAEHEKHLAFNNQSLGTRFAVVFAGPGFNFAFAILAYWLMFMVGITGLKPIVDKVEPNTPVAAAGLQAGDQIVAVNQQPVLTWERVIQLSIAEVLSGHGVDLAVEDSQGRQRFVSLRQDLLQLDDVAKGRFFDLTGIQPKRPTIPPLLDQVERGSPAERAGLRRGDLILKADGEPMPTWSQWVDYVQGHGGRRIELELQRDARILRLSVVPELRHDREQAYGRVGVGVQIPADMEQGLYAQERYPLGEALSQAINKTAEVSLLSVRMLWKMLSLEVSMENLSGPISIAQYAGRSAQVGFARFLEFLAIVSVSLGILNLLPIPLLDGGHLMYYLIELLRRKPVSEESQIQGQKVGIIVLAALMGVALFNDLARLLG